MSPFAPHAPSRALRAFASRPRAALAAALATFASPGVAAADPPAACVLEGTASVEKSAAIVADATKGVEIARFSGAKLPLVVKLAPATGGEPPRALVRTRGMRVEGLVEAASISLFASRELAIAPDHLAIAKGQRVRLASGSGSLLTVEMRASGALEGAFQAGATCDGLSLAQTSDPPEKAPPNARGWVAKRAAFDLLPKPGGAPVATLRVAEAKGGLLLWGVEARGAYVHVVAHDELTIDGWVAARELVALPKGELMDRLSEGTVEAELPKLAIEGDPAIVRAKADLPVRVAASDGAPTIGTVDADTELVVMETVTGWSSVLPRALDVLPPRGKSFWIRTTQLVGSPTKPAASAAPASSR